MNILHIRPFFEPGGVSNYVNPLSEALAQRGNKIVYACQDLPNIQEIRRFGIVYPGICIFPSSVPNLVRSAQQIKKIIESEEIEIVVSHHRFASLVSKLAVLNSGIPHISSVHEIKGNRRLSSRLAMGKHIIAVSNIVKQQLIRDFGISPKMISVVKMGISTQQEAVQVSEDALRARYQKNGKGPIIGYFGRLDPEKGVIYLLQAIPGILEEFPTATFLIVGDGKERKALEEMSQNLGIANHMCYLGWRDDIRSLLEIPDIVIMPSVNYPQAEGLPLTAIEALSKKKALIATDSGGLAELITHLQNGYSIPQANPTAIKEGVLYLLNNPDIRKMLGENGYQTVLDEYTVEKMVQDTLFVYQSMIDNPEYSNQGI